MITKERLEKLRADFARQREQHLQDAIALLGAMQAVDLLLKEAQEPQPPAQKAPSA